MEQLSARIQGQAHPVLSHPNVESLLGSGSPGTPMQLAASRAQGLVHSALDSVLEAKLGVPGGDVDLDLRVPVEVSGPVHRSDEVPELAGVADGCLRHAQEQAGGGAGLGREIGACLQRSIEDDGARLKLSLDSELSELSVHDGLQSRCGDGYPAFHVGALARVCRCGWC